MKAVDGWSTQCLGNDCQAPFQTEADTLANALSQQLTVISHYVDAYEHMASSESAIQPQSVAAWAQLIRAQLEAGRTTIRHLEQLVRHGQ